MHKCAVYNNLSAWGETVSKLINTFESKSNIAIDWFTKDKRALINSYISSNFNYCPLV